MTGFHDRQQQMERQFDREAAAMDAVDAACAKAREAVRDALRVYHEAAPVMAPEAPPLLWRAVRKTRAEIAIAFDAALDLDTDPADWEDMSDWAPDD